MCQKLPQKFIQWGSLESALVRPFREICIISLGQLHHILKRKSAAVFIISCHRVDLTSGLKKIKSSQAALLGDWKKVRKRDNEIKWIHQNPEPNIEMTYV